MSALHDTRPCDRCGRRRRVNKQRKHNLCADCVIADPEYIRLIEGNERESAGAA